MKAILVVVSHGFGGYGDFIFGLSLARGLRDNYEGRCVTPPHFYIITEAKGKEDIYRLKGHTEFAMTVLTPDELREQTLSGDITVGGILEGPVFNEGLIQSVLHAVPNGKNIPLIMVPEYGIEPSSLVFSRIQYNQDRREAMSSNVKLIFSGFGLQPSSPLGGILLNQQLMNIEPLDVVVSQLDEPVKGYLLGTTSTIEQYRTRSAFYFQYSHDEPFFKAKSIFLNSAAEHFCHVHREFVKNTTENQDVLMVGEDFKTKLAALLSVKDALISDGFTNILFCNMDTKEELTIYCSLNSAIKKTYRALYTHQITHQSMISCIALSGDIMGVTGDQSFGEALSNNKIVIYERYFHKQDLINSYYNGLNQLITDLNPPESESLRKVIALFKGHFCPKGQFQNNLSVSEYLDLGLLLRNEDIKVEFKRLVALFVQRHNLVLTVDHVIHSEINLQAAEPQYYATRENNHSYGTVGFFVTNASKQTTNGNTLRYTT